MATSRVAAVICGVVALLGPSVCAAVQELQVHAVVHTQTQSEPDEPPQFKDYVEYSWAFPATPAGDGGTRTRDECPRGFLPVWTLQRCRDAAASWAREGITTDIKPEIVENVSQATDVSEPPPGCTLESGDGGAVSAVSFRDVRTTKWAAVKPDLPANVHRVCYRLYLLVDGECPAAFQVMSDLEQCKEVAKTFAGQDTVPAAAVSTESHCSVGPDYKFTMDPSDARRVCALKDDIIAYQKGEDCPLGQDLPDDECRSLSELWPRRSEYYAGTPCDRDGRCTCYLRSPGAWHWHNTPPRPDLAPYCRSR